MKQTTLVLSCLACAAFSGTALRADEEAVRETVESYVAAFNEHDAEALAAHWSEQAVHVDRGTGARIEGREALQADFAELFESQPGIRLSGSVGEIRMVTPDVATLEGRALVFTQGEEPGESIFSAVLVKQGEKWLLDSVREAPVPVPETPADALRELSWMVGRWVDVSETVTVETNVRWAAGESFLVRSYTVTGAGSVLREGTQIIGWDPRAKQIRSWTFNSDGSFGDGTWSKNGEDWMVKSSQVLADGKVASGTFVMTRVDDDTLAVQLIGHDVEGEPQPASDVIQVVRVVEEDAAAAESTSESGEAAATEEGSAAKGGAK